MIEYSVSEYITKSIYVFFRIKEMFWKIYTCILSGCLSQINPVKDMNTYDFIKFQVSIFLLKNWPNAFLFQIDVKVCNPKALNQVNPLTLLSYFFLTQNHFSSFTIVQPQSFLIWGSTDTLNHLKCCLPNDWIHVL